MQKFFSTTIFTVLIACTMAQAPQRFSFQAVVRNNVNELLINSPVGMRTTILQGNPNGTIVYQEFYSPNPQTNANGLVTLEIGSGFVLSGNFSIINWASGPYFIKTEADPTGGSNYTITGTSQLMSVPYALHAKTAEALIIPYSETDPVFIASPAGNITNTHINNWNTAYTNRILSASGTAPLTLTISSNQLSGSMAAANASTSGYLTSGDWNTFNNKVSSQWITSGSNIYFNAGRVGAGTSAPNASAQLDVSSTTRGFLPPRLATVQMNAISSPAQGLMVYNTSLNSVFYYNGGAWINTDDGKPCGTLTYEGVVYKTIMIGTHCWMTENLKYLPAVVGPGTGSNTVPYYYVYGYYGTSVSAAKATANYQTYGVLYNWPAALTACPTGWHLPTDAEWTALTAYVSSQTAYRCDNTSTIIAKSLAATTNWAANTGTCTVGNNLSANNATGFSWLPGSLRSTDGVFINLSYGGYWWSSTEYSTTSAWGRHLGYTSSGVSRANYTKGFGFSVRCLRD